MKRLLLMGAMLALLPWAAGSAAQAQTPGERVVAALEKAGYRIETQERTFLGRLRIVAVRGALKREVVVNPGTGEVLRDIALQGGGGDGAGKNPGIAPTIGIAAADPGAPTVGAVVGVGGGPDVGAGSLDIESVIGSGPIGGN